MTNNTNTQSPEPITFRGTIPKARDITSTKTNSPSLSIVTHTSTQTTSESIVKQIEAYKKDRESCFKEVSSDVVKTCPRYSALEKTESIIELNLLNYDGDDKKTLIDLFKQAQSIEPDTSELSQITSSFISCADFVRTKISEPDKIIDGVLYKARKMCINASSKAGKTKLLMLLGITASEGLPFLGMQTKQAKVLYFNLELGTYETQDRFKKIQNEIAPNAELNNLILFNYREYLRTHQGTPLIKLLPRLAKEIAKQGFGLIIIDPIYKLYSSDLDENSANDVALLLNSLESVVNMTDAALVYSHHYSKGDASRKSSLDRSSGSGVFTRDPDAIINVTELEVKDKDDAYIVEFKLRSFAPKKAFGIRINGFKIVIDSRLNLNNLKKVSQYKQVFKTDEILTLLQIKPYKTVSSLCNDVKEATGMSNTAFYNLWRDAKQLDGVKEDKDGNWTYNPTSI